MLLQYCRGDACHTGCGPGHDSDLVKMLGLSKLKVHYSTIQKGSAKSDNNDSIITPENFYIVFSTIDGSK